MKTLTEIEAPIETRPLPERLRLYKDMPQSIRRDAEDLDWQRLGLEIFSGTNARKPESMTSFRIGDIVSVAFPLSDPYAKP
jgi:hypothetical protein